MFNCVQDLLKVHGHEGRTVLEPVLDGDYVQQLENRARQLHSSLCDAIAFIDQHGLAVPDELRLQLAPLPASRVGPD
jgi:hypothetical protein